MTQTPASFYYYYIIIYPVLFDFRISSIFVSKILLLLLLLLLLSLPLLLLFITVITILTIINIIIFLLLFIYKCIELSIQLLKFQIIMLYYYKYSDGFLVYSVFRIFFLNQILIVFSYYYWPISHFISLISSKLLSSKLYFNPVIIIYPGSLS